MARRLVVVTALVAIVVSMAVSAEAQTSGASESHSKTVLLGTPTFARLVEGKRMLVTTTDGKQHEGLVTSASPKDMVVDGETLSLDQITKVEKVTHRLRATLIGLVAGFGTGLVLNFAACDDDDGCPAVIGALAVGGVVAGIGLGAVAYGGFRDVVYKAPTHKPTIALAPIVTPTRKGVSFSMSWR